MNFFAELKRRNVYRVAVAYLVVSWGLMQFADIISPLFDLPLWTQKLILVLLALGFVPTLIAAWAFELTPEGIKRDRDVDQSMREGKGRKLNHFIIGMLALVIAILLVDRLFLVEIQQPPPDETEVALAERSVAVLSFADLSQDQDHDWFAVGLAEEIMNALARTPDIMVASRTSVAAYRGSDKDVPTIARELGVAHVLEGSVRRSGDRIRVTAQLVRAADGFHLWSQTYDRDAEDIIAVQEDVALRIASALDTTMNPEALADMMSVGTRSVRAYQAYIRGLSLRARSLRTSDWQYYLDAYDQFELARSIDPRFSMAHREAADFWKVQLNPSRRQSGLTELPPKEVLRNFMERIDLAVDTAKNETERSGSRAQRATVQLRLRNAIRRFREYLDARPNDIQAWSDLLLVAQVAADRATISEALDTLKTTGGQNRIAAALYVANAQRLLDASLAADYGLNVLERWPNDSGISYQTQRALLWSLRIDEAANLRARMDPNLAGDEMMDARQACAEGRRDDVLRILEDMRSAERRQIAEEWLVLMMLDERDSALQLITPLASGDVPYALASWLVYPMFDPRPFPSLIQMLDRENVERAPTVDIPFACPAG